MDEMWGFVHTREPHLNEGDPAEWGSTMLWLALDSETKLLITHHVGGRNGVSAHAFVSDLRARTDGRYQVTSDQYNAYVGAMREHFGQNVDFGQLRKIYGRCTRRRWYGGGQVVGAVPHVKIGRPDFSRISTSHVERTNFSADASSPFHAPNQCSQQDARTLKGGCYALCRLLQLLSRSPDREGYPRDGCGVNRSRLDVWRNCWVFPYS